MRKFKLRILDRSKDDLILERRYDSVSGLFAVLLVIFRFYKESRIIIDFGV